jgi:hypothetical protein
MERFIIKKEFTVIGTCAIWSKDCETAIKLSEDLPVESFETSVQSGVFLDISENQNDYHANLPCYIYRKGGIEEFFSFTAEELLRKS